MSRKEASIAHTEHAEDEGSRIIIIITRRRDAATLDKYGLKANDQILAEEKHMGLYEDLLQNYDAKLIAGGAAQNTARGAQVSRRRRHG